jgi:hypothetical protein
LALQWTLWKRTHKDSASEAVVVVSNFVLRLVAATVMTAGMFAGTMLQALTRPLPALVDGPTHTNTNWDGRASISVMSPAKRWAQSAIKRANHLPQQRQARRVG